MTGPQVGRRERVAHGEPEEQNHLRKPGGEEHYHQECGPPRHHVIAAGQRPHQVQIDSAFSAVPAEELRRHHRREDEEDDRGDPVQIAVGRQVHPFGGSRSGQSLHCAGDQGHDEADRGQHRYEEPGEELGPSAPSQTHGDTEPILEHREAAPANAFAHPGVVAVADVEDGAALGGRSCRASRGSGAHAAPRSKSSARARRRGAIRRSGAWASINASRT